MHRLYIYPVKISTAHQLISGSNRLLWTCAHNHGILITPFNVWCGGIHQKCHAISVILNIFQEDFPTTVSSYSIRFSRLQDGWIRYSERRWRPPVLDGLEEWQTVCDIKPNTYIPMSGVGNIQWRWWWPQDFLSNPQLDWSGRDM